MGKRYELLNENINIEDLDFEEIRNLIETYKRGGILSPEEEKRVKMILFISNPEDLKIDVIAGIKFDANRITKTFLKMPVILNTKQKLAIPLYTFDCEEPKKRFII